MNEILLEETSDLHHTQQAIQLHSAEREAALTTFWTNVAEQETVKLGVQASYRWPQSRNERVTRLRARIEAGTYHIESQALATCMLNNENHFLSVNAH